MPAQLSDVFPGWGLFFPIGMFIVMLVLAILVCGRGARRFSGPGGCCGRGDAPREDPVEILRCRYAKGEITKEDFARVRGDLRAEMRGTSS